tara:strand:- start:1028 stop:1399 length:372 start_codon:yes stop_codon:yes gene_type:complete
MAKDLYIKRTIAEQRTSGVVTSLLVTLKAYSKSVEGTKTYKNESGEEITETIPTYVDDDFLGEESFTYSVPTSDQTSLAKGTSHPHNHSNEIAYAEKYSTWVSSIKESTEYRQKVDKLITQYV